VIAHVLGGLVGLGAELVGLAGALLGGGRPRLGGSGALLGGSPHGLQLDLGGGRVAHGDDRLAEPVGDPGHLVRLGAQRAQQLGAGHLGHRHRLLGVSVRGHRAALLGVQPAPLPPRAHLVVAGVGTVLAWPSRSGRPRPRTRP
jgi:hypothetical protein